MIQYLKKMVLTLVACVFFAITVISTAASFMNNWEYWYWPVLFFVIGIIVIPKEEKRKRVTAKELNDCISQEEPVGTDSGYNHSNQPTKKKLAYARDLGITDCHGMTRLELSDKINLTLYLRRHPGLKSDFEDLEELEEEEGGFILAVYNQRKETIVDVLWFNEIYWGWKKKTIILGVSAPKLVKDKHIGKYLDFDRDFELPLTSLLYFEKSETDFESLDKSTLDTYVKVVQRGLKVAHRQRGK